MTKPYIEEFLFRGRCPTGEPDMRGTYHVRVGQWVTGPDAQPKQVLTDPLSPGAAETLGYDLSSICNAVTAQAIRDKEAAEATVTRLRAELDKIKSDFAVEKSKLVEQARLDAKQLARVQAELDAAKAVNLDNELNDAIGVIG
jgi:hypothetical protein